MILVPALNHAHPAMGRMVSQETSPLRGIIAPANGAASLFNAVDNDKATLGGTPSSALVPILGQTLGISNGTAGFGAAPKGSNAPKGTYFFVGTFDGGSGSTRNIASSNTTGTGGWRFEIQGSNALNWIKNGIAAVTSFSVAYAAGTPVFVGVSWDVTRIQNFVVRDLTTGRVTYFTANDTAAFGSDSSATSRVLGTWAGNFSGKCKLAGLLPVYMPMAALLQLSEQPFEVLDDWFRTRAIGKTPTGGVGTITGTGAATLPALTASASGTPVITGSAAGTLPSATGAAAGSPVVSGSAAGTLSSTTGAASGTPVITGTGAGTVPSVTGSAANTTTGTGAGTLPSLTGSGVGTPVIVGSTDGTVPSLTGAASGAPIVTGIAAAVLPSLTGSASGTPIIVGSGAGTLPRLTGEATDGLSLEVPPTRGAYTGAAAAKATYTKGARGRATYTGANT
jgi:hypothetical protein